MAMELFVLRRLYARDHLDQVLATFALILIFNQSVTLLFGRQPLFVSVPSVLNGSVQLLPGLTYPIYRLIIIAVGLLVALGLYLLINRTRIGMLVRAGATHREMVRALGVDIRLLYTAVFGLGALLAGLAGLMAGPILAVQVGMGEQILIMTFVVVVIGGVGSIRGAFFGALIVGLVDTVLRAFLPGLLRQVMAGSEADALGAGLASMGIYMLMAVVLLVRPKGLFPANV
jgi:branched-chain amino acid transport system permease protein